LKLAAGQRYLVDQSGAPFLIVADSAWSLIAAVTTADATTYLEDRRQKGFNTVLVNLIEHKFAPNAPKNAAGDAPFTGTLSGGTADFTTPNETYFAHADQVLEVAAQKGIQVLLVPSYYGCCNSEGWSAELAANGATRLTTYGNYVGNRYKNFPNIIWVEGGDNNPTDRSVVEAVATGIKAMDPNHLHTAHCGGGTSPLDLWAGESWLDVDNVYTYASSTGFVSDKSRMEYTRSGWKPFFLIESGYEGESAGTEVGVRQQAYEALLNGGMGETFGNRPVWAFESGWQAALNLQGSQDMSRVASLFASRHWERLVPDTAGTFLTAGASSGGSFASASLSTDGKLAIVYTPAVRALTFNMAKMTGTTTVRWYDPSSGAFTAVSGSPFANTGSQSFTPPGNNSTGSPDWVLVFEAP
jgi:hypothetical protein